MTTRHSYLRFVIEMLEPGGVTTPPPMRWQAVDAEIDTDPRGNPCIPGTSLAGSLRARVHERYGSETADAWFGCVGPAGKKEATNPGAPIDAVASPLWVLGASVAGADLPERNPRPILTTTAIDPNSGAARLRTMRTVERLPAGTNFVAYVRWDGASPEDLERLRDAVDGWRPLIGRGVSAGRGLCAISDLREGTLDTSVESDLLRWLTMSGPELVEAVATKPLPLKENRKATLEVAVSWRTEGPLVVGSPPPELQDRPKPKSADEGPSFLPMHREADDIPTIPATSIKGAVRSRMGYILRSVGLRACLDKEAQTCGDPTCLTCAFFGHGGGDNRQDFSVGQRGRVRVLAAPVTGWGSDEPVVRKRTHGPLDRFTGGAAARSPVDESIHRSGKRGGLLHTIEGVEAAAFTTRFDMSALPAELRDTFRALLRLVCDDFHDGLVGLGHATTRGYGSIRVAGDGDGAGWGGLPSSVAARAHLAGLISGATQAGDNDD